MFMPSLRFARLKLRLGLARMRVSCAMPVFWFRLLPCAAALSCARIESSPTRILAYFSNCRWRKRQRCDMPRRRHVTYFFHGE